MHFELIEFLLKYLVLLFTELLRPNMNGLKLFPHLMSGFLAMHTSKELFSNSIKQNIFGSSISFCVVLIHNTNGFVGNLPSKRVKSVKITRHAGFPIAVVSPIKLGWSTTPQGHFSRLLDPKKRAYALIPIERIVAQERGVELGLFRFLTVLNLPLVLPKPIVQRPKI